MKSVAVSKVRIDEAGRLHVFPTSNPNRIFQFVYRAAMQVDWNEEDQDFCTPVPGELSYADWYLQVLSAVQSELGVLLRLEDVTSWENVSPAVEQEIRRRATDTQNPADVVARICNLPVEFRTRRTLSVIRLVGESGYWAAPESLTTDAVSTYLRTHPHLIDAWLMHSEDKRSTHGWYIKPLSGNTFEVGYYPAGERIVIAGPADACAEFIVREIRSIACP